MHACDPVPIVMGFRLTALRAAGAPLKFEKENRQNPLITIPVVCFLQTRLLTEKFSRARTIHPGIFRGRALSIRAFSADRHYGLIVALRR